MSDCFSRGPACNTMHDCSLRGCQRKSLGYSPVDRNAFESIQREADATKADAQRFRTLCETSPVLCFMGQDYSSADKFRAAIDAYRAALEKP